MMPIHTLKDHTIENLKVLHYLLTKRYYSFENRFNMQQHDQHSVLENIILLSYLDTTFKPLDREKLSNNCVCAHEYLERLFEAGDDWSFTHKYLFSSSWSYYDNSLKSFLQRVQNVIDLKVTEQNYHEHTPPYNKKLAYKLKFKKLFNKYM